MDATTDDICVELERDLCLAVLELVAARARLRVTATRADRAAVARCRARVDVVLDLLRELEGGPSSPAVLPAQLLLDAPGRPRRT